MQESQGCKNRKNCQKCKNCASCENRSRRFALICFVGVHNELSVGKYHWRPVPDAAFLLGEQDTSGDRVLGAQRAHSSRLALTHLAATWRRGRRPAATSERGVLALRWRRTTSMHLHRARRCRRLHAAAAMRQPHACQQHLRLQLRPFRVGDMMHTLGGWPLIHPAWVRILQ